MPEAEVVVEVVRTGQIRVQIEGRLASQSTGGDPRLSLQVNDVVLPLHTTRPGNQIYAWLVPAHAWKVGANRFRLGVSRLVSPVEERRSQEPRLLGFAVRLIRLELVGTD